MLRDPLNPNTLRLGCIHRKWGQCAEDYIAAGRYLLSLAFRMFRRHHVDNSLKDSRRMDYS
jgi:hypothetical protein